MSGNTGLRIAGAVLLTVLLIGAAAAIGYMAYSAGWAQGASQAGAQLAAPAVAPVTYYGYAPYAVHPFGAGLLWCLAPLFFLFVLFFAVRLVFGGFGHRHGPWGWPRGPWGSEEMKNHWQEKAEQWHREMHEGGGAKA